jgi:hypothetical protein
MQELQGLKQYLKDWPLIDMSDLELFYKKAKNKEECVKWMQFILQSKTTAPDEHIDFVATMDFYLKCS